MAKSSIESACEELCRDCITRFVPDEAPFFDTIWQAARGRMFGGDSILPPAEWELRTAATGTPGALLLHGEAENLATVSIVSTLCAVVIEVVSSESRSKQSLDDLLAKYRDTFGTPEWAIPHIKSLVKARIERPTHRPPRLKVVATPEKPYQIWENQKECYGGTLEDVKRLRQAAQKGDYDIFLDDGEGELLIFGRTASDWGVPALEPGETFGWATLTAMLERVGSRWTYEDLYAKVSPDDEYETATDSPRVQQWIRHVKVVLDRAIIKSGHSHPDRPVNSWFDTRQRRRVDISDKLRACLIRRCPAS